MERAITYFVKTELFDGKQLPPTTSRRFFPESSDYRIHMYRATSKYRHSKIDQENLKLKIDEWEKGSNDYFFYRPYKEVIDRKGEKEQMFFNEHGDFIGEVSLRTHFFEFNKSSKKHETSFEFKNISLNENHEISEFSMLIESL